MAQTCYYPLELPHAGRVSIAEGDSVATFTGVALSGLPLAGGTIWILPDDAAHYPAGLIADPVDDEYENLELPLVTPWEGTSISSAKFVIAYGAGANDPVKTNSAVARFRSMLQNGAGLVFIGSGYPDEAMIPNGSLRWIVETEQFELKIAGTWTPLNLSNLGTFVGRWDGNRDRFALSIATGDVAVDFDDGELDASGVAQFELTLSDDAELQLPTNVEVDDAFDILFIGGGAGNVPTFASGFSGEPSTVIRTAANAQTRLRFRVTSETGGAATAVAVSKVTYAATDVVEHKGALFRSNVASNFDEPAFDGPDPYSTSSWTWTNTKKGDPGSALLVATSVSSVGLSAGTKTFTLYENEERGFGAGSTILVADAANPTTKYMRGTVLSYDHPALEISVPADEVVGSGTVSNWVVSLSGPRGQAGTQPGLVYEFDTTVSAGADPGTMRANNASLTLATALYVADEDASGEDQSGYLAEMGDSTSTTLKGHAFVKRVVNGKSTIFKITGATTPASGYTTIPVEYVSGPDAIPNEALISLEDQQKGDAGSGASSFTDLDDVPANYSGHGGKAVKVKGDASGLEFVALGDTAAKNTGTGAGTVAAGDDSRFTTAASETVAGHVELATSAEALTGTDTTRAVHPAGLKAVADTKQDITRRVNTLADANYTLVLSDAGKVILTHQFSTSRNITVPPNGSVAFPLHTQIDFIRGGQDAVFVAGSGVTIYSVDGKLKLNKNASACSLLKIDTNAWYLFGDLKA